MHSFAAPISIGNDCPPLSHRSAIGVITPTRHPGSLSIRPRWDRRQPFHLLAQPDLHAETPVQRGVSVDQGVQRLAALAVALGLLGANRTPTLKAGDDALGCELAEVIGVEAAGEFDDTGSRLSFRRT